MEKLIIPSDLENQELKEVISEVEEITEVKRGKRSAIPTNDVDLISMAKRIGDYWSKTNLTLKWITAQEFIDNVTTFELAQNTQTTTRATRSPMAAQLSALNKEIDINIEHVKNYLTEKYGKRSATSYYAKFGISKIFGSYKLPKDQEYRVKALQELLKGLESEGFSDKVYGTDYWTNIYNTYYSLVDTTSSNISQVSAQVMTKHQFRTNIKQVLNSLLLLIKANNPNTFESENRVWGFQREKY